MQNNNNIDWSEYLAQYGEPTIFKESLLKPFFETEQIIEPILDAGCGTGYFSVLLCKRGFHVFGIDLHTTVPKIDLFTFLESDIISFKTEQKFKTILLINILTTASKQKQLEILKKTASLKAPDGKIYVINTNSDLFGNNFDHQLLSIEKIYDGYVKVRTKLVNGQDIEFNDFTVTSEEMHQMCFEAKLNIKSEKQFSYPGIEKPIYNLYILK